ncbi:MAG: tetratricopeptide repeat protein [Bacteroidota bacterium]
MESCQCKTTQSASIQEIEQLHLQLAQALQTTTWNHEQAVQLIQKSTAYAAAYPTDSRTPTYLFRAADLARGIGKYQQAIELWKEVEEKYATFEKTPEAIFFQGFTYENHLSDIQKAQQHYRDFLRQYPTHKLRPTVEQSLLQLSDTPMDLIKQFERKRHQREKQ